MPLPSNWGAYLGDGTATGGARDSTFTTQEGWQQALQWVKQFDPNASIQGTQTPSGDQGQYLSFNNSLLPTNSMGGKGILGAANVDALQDANHYVGPRAQDANLGNIGSSAYAQRSLTDRGTWLDVVGPLLVGGFAGLGGGGFNLISSLMQKAPQFLGGLNSLFTQPQQQLTPQQIALMQMMQQGQGPGG